MKRALVLVAVFSLLAASILWELLQQERIADLEKDLVVTKSQLVKIEKDAKLLEDRISTQLKESERRAAEERIRNMRLHEEPNRATSPQ
jgi:hypothetical protein